MSDGLPPLQRLLLAHAPTSARSWQEVIWSLDARLAAIVRGANEPMIALIRMAWWEEALVADDRSKGNGEPLVEAWRATNPGKDTRAHAEQLIMGWRILIESREGDEAIDLDRYATQRGEGLFGLIGGENAHASSAGAVWALWDLAGHVRDEGLARRAIVIAGDISRRSAPARKDIARPLRLALAVALPDVRAGRIPEPFGPRQYLRLLRALIFA